MSIKPKIPVDQYFRELEAWARSKGCNRPLQENRAHRRTANVLDFVLARKRLRTLAQ